MNTRKILRSCFAGACALAWAAAASAGPIFHIDPNAVSSNTNTYVQGTYFTGGSAELITASSATAASATGWVQLNTLYNGSTSVLSGISGLNNDYQLYAEFSLDLTLTSGSMLGAGSTYSINSLNFKLYADNTGGTIFNTPNASTGGYTGGSGPINYSGSENLLATGALFGTGNTASINTSSTGGLGAALNATTDFAVCNGAGTAMVGSQQISDSSCLNGDGYSYFAEPHPFYRLALEGFNNAGGGVTVNSPYAAIVDASGNIDFKPIPEPSVVAVLAIGLLGLGVVGLRRRKA